MTRPHCGKAPQSPYFVYYVKFPGLIKSRLLARPRGVFALRQFVHFLPILPPALNPGFFLFLIARELTLGACIVSIPP